MFGFGKPKINPAAPSASLGPRDIAKAPRHVARFERALAQATIPARRKQLKAWRDYWRHIAAAPRPPVEGDE